MSALETVAKPLAVANSWPPVGPALGVGDAIGEERPQAPSRRYRDRAPAPDGSGQEVADARAVGVVEIAAVIMLSPAAAARHHGSTPVGSAGRSQEGVRDYRRG